MPSDQNKFMQMSINLFLTPRVGSETRQLLPSHASQLIREESRLLIERKSRADDGESQGSVIFKPVDCRSDQQSIKTKFSSEILFKIILPLGPKPSA